MTPDDAYTDALVAGAATAAIGLPMLLAPVKTRRLTGILDPKVARIIGITDLAIAPGLLLAERKSPWLLARAAANVVAGVALLRQPTWTARLAAVTLVGLTVRDVQGAVALRSAGR